MGTTFTEILNSGGLKKEAFFSTWVVGIHNALSSLVNKGFIVPLLSF